MSEIRRPGRTDRPLIPPVEPVSPGQANQGHKEGDKPHQPEEIKVREGKRKRIWVPDPSGTYGADGALKGSWKMLTREEAEELGLKWSE